MISYDEALAAIAALPLAPSSARVPLAMAFGHICADDLRLPRDQPPFDRSAMDGYAVAPAPDATRFRIVGSVPAGAAFPRALAPGEAVRILTGAPCPPGATVVPREVAREEDGHVVCEPAALAPGRNVAKRGEDGCAGDVVVARGARLTPTTLALAAACGARDLSIAVAPRLALVTTGDEVGGAGDAGISDTNGPYLAAFAEALLCPMDREHAGDDATALAAALERTRRTNLVITTGGVGGSDKDLVPAVAAKLGFVTVLHQVAMQPGKPVLVARHGDGRILVGLPGNPVSVMATAHVILLPIIDRWLGARGDRWRELPLAVAATNRGKRRLFQPARVVAGGVAPVPWNGSGDFIAAAAGDGFVDLAAGAALAAGGAVRFLPYVGSTIGDGGQLPPRQRRP